MGEEGSHLPLSKPHQDAVVTGAGLCAALSGRLRGTKEKALKGKEARKEAFKARGQGRMRRWLPKADRRKHKEVHGQRKMRLLVGHHQKRLCLLQEGSWCHAVRVPDAQVLLQEV